jgi:hypothetical protein
MMERDLQIANYAFFRIGQQLGARHHFPIAQDDKEDTGISWLHATRADPKETESEFTLLAMRNF